MDTVPADLRKALAKNQKAKAKWADLTPIARRDFVSWIVSAKQDTTRKRRVEVACSKLVAGKRRPCCYALVPMNLYKALAVIPKAKATWKELTPDGKRDFIDWIDKAHDADMHADRINKTCMMLAAGKRHP